MNDHSELKIIHLHAIYFVCVSSIILKCKRLYQFPSDILFESAGKLDLNEILYFFFILICNSNCSFVSMKGNAFPSDFYHLK